MTFADYLTRHLRVPFCWASHNCVSFVAGYVKEATGIDHLAGILEWSNEQEARQIVKDMGGMEAILDSRFTRIAPHFAKDGDIALRGKTLGLVSGNYMVSPGEKGLVNMDRIGITCAWSY